MPPLPYLVNEEALKNVDVNVMLTLGLLHLGEVGNAAGKSSPDLRDPLKRAREAAKDSGVLNQWERLLAMEWLVANPSESGTPGILDSFADRCLSDSAELSARALQGNGAVVALIPLAGCGENAPEVAAMILSRATGDLPDNRRDWEGSEEFLTGHGLRLDTVRAPRPTSRVTGRSWQLGAHLAWYCIKTGDDRARQDLAGKWLTTGAVEKDDQLTVVEWGNKIDIPHSNRRWLVPDGMESAPERLQVTSCRSLDRAWKLISGQGTVERRKRAWPKAQIFHSFTSGAREPVIAAVLLARPRRVVLWQTDNEETSRKPASDIQCILRELKPELSIELKDISSTSMEAVEKALDKEISAEQGPTLFNVTQGNRLMGFAVHTLARKYHSLWMLYRDNDDKGIDFTAIQYDGRDYPETFTLGAERASIPDINWDNLLHSVRPRPMVSWEELLKKIRVGTGNSPS
jgi:hypothetical protein